VRKAALITGGGRGIGFGIAKALAAETIHIAIMDLLPEESVKENLVALRGLGAQALYLHGDVTSAADRARVLEQIEATFGGLNILVNNAGVAPKVRADILGATEESWDFVLRINLKGPYFLTQAAANSMIRQKKANAAFPACIINISSVSSTVASPSRGEYCISKAGVSMATKLWAARLGEFDGLCLQKRWGFPEDIGRAVAMLARGDLPYSTGQVILIDGGMTVPRL
jgi:NAD(P)-dependent dehydrogenase (short-subunit alcohol dehydrogenase family)